MPFKKFSKFYFRSHAVRIVNFRSLIVFPNSPTTVMTFGFFGNTVSDLKFTIHMTCDLKQRLTFES